MPNHRAVDRLKHLFLANLGQPVDFPTIHTAIWGNTSGPEWYVSTRKVQIFRLKKELPPDYRLRALRHGPSNTGYILEAINANSASSR